MINENLAMQFSIKKFIHTNAFEGIGEEVRILPFSILPVCKP